MKIAQLNSDFLMTYLSSILHILLKKYIRLEDYDSWNYNRHIDVGRLGLDNLDLDNHDLDNLDLDNLDLDHLQK